MNVIEHGKAYNKVTCPTCEAIFGYTAKDAISYASQDKIEDKVYQLKKVFVNCPECGTPIVLSSNTEEVVPKDDTTEVAE
jgi:uncharacterized protein with PIN domain